MHQCLSQIRDLAEFAHVRFLLRLRCPHMDTVSLSGSFLTKRFSYTCMELEEEIYVWRYLLHSKP